MKTFNTYKNNIITNLFKRWYRTAYVLLGSQLLICYK